jgi:hypothetical protein
MYISSHSLKRISKTVQLQIQVFSDDRPIIFVAIQSVLKINKTSVLPICQEMFIINEVLYSIFYLNYIPQFNFEFYKFLSTSDRSYNLPVGANYVFFFN